MSLSIHLGQDRSLGVRERVGSVRHGKAFGAKAGLRDDKRGGTAVGEGRVWRGGEMWEGVKRIYRKE